MFAGDFKEARQPQVQLHVEKEHEATLLYNLLKTVYTNEIEHENLTFEDLVSLMRLAEKVRLKFVFESESKNGDADFMEHVRRDE
jgi:hypothetical protein